jgi:predicted NAD/FAD-binding protein
MKIGIIGTGIAGLSAAWALSKQHEITVFEAKNRLGGHSNTIEIDGLPPVDTGFIVYNEATYPNLIALFDHLRIPVKKTDMSFGVSLRDGAVEYAGGRPFGLIAQPKNLTKLTYWRMLRDIIRFYRQAPKLLERQDPDTDLSLGDYLTQYDYSDAFIRDHLLPMGAAIWSTPDQKILDFPARSFVQFFVNHGLLKLFNRPQWYTVDGGSKTYVDRIADPLTDRIELNTTITALTRHDDHIELSDPFGQSWKFDRVVIATHGDQALRILGSRATQAEGKILSNFNYSKNIAYLHQDTALMPQRKPAWASWNYLTQDQTSDETGDDTVCVTYWMNLLQSLETEDPLLVTLNPPTAPAEHKTHAVMTYHHPMYDRAALSAQSRLPEIQGADRVWFAGSYCGYGFHEDGVTAGLMVARQLGADIPWTLGDKSPAYHNCQSACV